MRILSTLVILKLATVGLAANALQPYSGSVNSFMRPDYVTRSMVPGLIGLPRSQDVLSQLSNPDGLSGYVPLGSPYSNAADEQLTNYANAIPVTQECTVRPQTVIEIQKVRKSAAQMAATITLETTNIAKRKAYIEQMSTYLNDRIRDLNKVKQELLEELRWVDKTNEEIQYLNQKERQMKVQDILKCMKNGQRANEGARLNAQQIIDAVQKSSTELDKNVVNLQSKIRSIETGDPAQTEGEAKKDEKPEDKKTS